MTARVEREVIPMRGDARGWVFEPLGPAGLPGQRNVHVVLTEPGRVRGNHLHRRGTEVLCVVGPALVRFRERGEVWDAEVPAGEAHRFTIPPGVSHAVRNPGPGACLVVSFNTEAHDPERPDVEPDVLLEP